MAVQQCEAGDAREQAPTQDHQYSENCSTPRPWIASHDKSLPGQQESGEHSSRAERLFVVETFQEVQDARDSKYQCGSDPSLPFSAL